MKLGIYETLKLASEQKKKEDKIRVLRENNNYALAIVLQYCFEDKIKWLLPEDDLPYKPSKLHDTQNILINEAKRLYLFVEGGNPNLKQERREKLWIQLLENVDADDAILLQSIRLGKLPFKNLTKAIIQESFPEVFFPETEQLEKSNGQE